MEGRSRSLSDAVGTRQCCAMVAGYHPKFDVIDAVKQRFGEPDEVSGGAYTI